MLTVLLSVLLTVAQITKDPAASQEKPAEKQECQVSGQVVQQEGGQPLRKAHVVLRPTGAAEKLLNQITGEDGRFCFRNVVPGKYLLGAERKGFVKHKYGAEDTWSEGTVLAIEKGQKLEPMLMRLVRTSVITGKVVDEEGEPAQGIAVQALIPVDALENAGIMMGGDAHAENGMFPVQRAVTNDLGEFRLAGLPPGKYFVNAVDSDRLNVMGLADVELTNGEDDNSDEYAPTYYPGTTRAGEAVPIELKAGDETTAGLQLLHEKMVTISGVVVREDGAPAHAFISLRNAADVYSMLLFPSVILPDAEGRFSIKHVLPGPYIIHAQAMGPGKDEVQSARQKIEVGQQDISNLRLNLSKGVTLTGKISAEHGALPKLEANLSLTREEDIPTHGWQEIGKDGDLIVKGLQPGTYTVVLSNLPENYYLKKVMYGSHQSFDQKITIDSGVQPAKLELIVSPDGARIDGVVQNGRQEPRGGVTVLLRRSGQKTSESESTASTDQNGRFEFHSLAPGKYTLTVKKRGKANPQESAPETGVTVAEGEKKSVTVKVD